MTWRERLASLTSPFAIWRCEMIIIVEGIDRVGKTTLCDKIIDKYKDYNFRRFRDDTRYAHSHNFKDVNTEKINTLQNLIEEGFVDNVILDRYHMTEFVYGGCDRQYKNDDMYDIDRRLAALPKRDRHPIQVVLIYMVPTDIERSSAEHGKNLARHLRWYESFYETTRIKNKVRVDYFTMDEALAFIDQILWTEDMTSNDEEFDSGMMMPDSENKEESEETKNEEQEVDSDVHNESV